MDLSNQSHRLPLRSYTYSCSLQIQILGVYGYSLILTNGRVLISKCWDFNSVPSGRPVILLSLSDVLALRVTSYEIAGRCSPSIWFCFANQTIHIKSTYLLSRQEQRLALHRVCSASDFLSIAIPHQPFTHFCLIACLKKVDKPYYSL